MSKSIENSNRWSVGRVLKAVGQGAAAGFTLWALQHSPSVASAASIKDRGPDPVRERGAGCQPVDIKMALASDALDRSPKDGVTDGYMVSPPTGVGFEGMIMEGFVGNDVGAARRIKFGRSGLPVDGEVVGFDRVIEKLPDGTEVIRFVPKVCQK